MTGPESANLVTSLAAALRTQAEDLSLYAGFLFNTLAGALPANLLVVDRKKSMGQRLSGGEGDVVGVHVTCGDEQFSLIRKSVGAFPVATVAHTVGGIRLSSENVSFDGWATRLSQALVVKFQGDEAATANLARVFGVG